MSTYDTTEVCYYSEIPVGAAMVLPMAIKWDGKFVVTASIKNPVGYPAPMPYDLDAIEEGQWVYIAEPSAYGTRLGDVAYRKAQWAPERMTDIRREIVRIGEQEPARGVLAAVLTPNDVAYPAQDFPADCLVLMGRKARSVRQWGTWEVYRRWTDENGDRRMRHTTPEALVGDGIVYVRADYLEPDEKVDSRSWSGHTFIPAVWNEGNYAALMQDMRARTNLQTRDKVKVEVDKATYRANQASMAVAVAIPVIDPDKRTAGRGAWAAFVAWALYGSKKQVESNEADRRARMR